MKKILILLSLSVLIFGTACQANDQAPTPNNRLIVGTPFDVETVDNEIMQLCNEDLGETYCEYHETFRYTLNNEESLAFADGKKVILLDCADYGDSCGLYELGAATVPAIFLVKNLPFGLRQ